MLIVNASAIHGVGVFTTKRIPKGKRLRLIARDDWRFVKKPKKSEEEYVMRFCVWDGEGYHCPTNFSRMSLGWYLNDAEDPNMAPKGELFVTKRAIRAGEELTIDYDEL